MTYKTAKALAPVISSLLLSGCINMSTPPSEITSSSNTEHNYEEYTCSRLIDELGSLARSETQLVAAQERRVKMSNAQALVIGIEQGDGAEATDLATVRGKRQSVREAMVAKQCGK
jgi:hypothetical protein